MRRTTLDRQRRSWCVPRQPGLAKGTRLLYPTDESHTGASKWTWTVRSGCAASPGRPLELETPIEQPNLGRRSEEIRQCATHAYAEDLVFRARRREDYGTGGAIGNEPRHHGLGL